MRNRKEALFANFFVLEAMLQDPLEMVELKPLLVRCGILAFLITVVFDVVVAWALYELYRGHPLNGLSTAFRMMHAAIMGVAVFVLPDTLKDISAEVILSRLDAFNTIWLIGLFFFGIHLLLLARILGRPKLIAYLLALAGLMYALDTTAHILLPNYEEYAGLFLALVAVPSILGEMGFALWLLFKGGKD